jgi:GcrA cell cycle regulator
MEWNDDIIVRLRGMWMEGYSTAEIGRRIGVSKNAVVGKAHRLGLDPRPSPIRRGGPGEVAERPVPLRREIATSLAPLPVEPAVPTTAPEPRPDDIVEVATASPAAEVPPAVAAAPAALAPLELPPPPAAVVAPVRAVPPRSSRQVPCCWPIGEPGTRSFRFCDDEALPGKPYCSAHATLAYVKVRDRREEAA